MTLIMHVFKTFLFLFPFPNAAIILARNHSPKIDLLGLIPATSKSIIFFGDRWCTNAAQKPSKALLKENRGQGLIHKVHSLAFIARFTE
ncbi:hypothetical protein V6Z12_A08G059500 [Gossypium hirsutum]